jgi:hypothetical protein
MKLFKGLFVSALWSVYYGIVDAILVPREDVQLSVPLTGSLLNTSTHYDPVTWALYNPVFNQTTWESQPYVPCFRERAERRYRMGILDTEFPPREWDIGRLQMSR